MTRGVSRPWLCKASSHGASIGLLALHIGAPASYLWQPRPLVSSNFVRCVKIDSETRHVLTSSIVVLGSVVYLIIGGRSHRDAALLARFILIRLGSFNFFYASKAGTGKPDAQQWHGLEFQQITWTILTALTDTSIAATLIWFLRNDRTGFVDTDDLFNSICTCTSLLSLIVSRNLTRGDTTATIRTSLAPAVFAIIGIVLYVSFPILWLPSSSCSVRELVRRGAQRSTERTEISLKPLLASAQQNNARFIILLPMSNLYGNCLMSSCEFTALGSKLLCCPHHTGPSEL